MNKPPLSIGAAFVICKKSDTCPTFLLIVCFIVEFLLIVYIILLHSCLQS